MAGTVERVLEAAVEGQAQSPRFVQYQLSALHSALVKVSSEMQGAISKDTKQSKSETEIQLALALNYVATLLAESKLEDALKSEFKLARLENSPNNLAPYGVAHIVPSKFNLVYSCVTAVAAAIAAGNSVVLELPRTLSSTSDLLTNILSSALDQDTFAIIDKQPDLTRSSTLTISLNGSPDSNTSTSKRSLAVANTRSVALVDRSADLSQAAASILRARFAFGGQSPIAPDLVLVDEFRVREFCAAIAEKTSKYFAEQVEMNGSSHGAIAAGSRSSRTSAHELDKAGAETVISGSRGSVVRVSSRKSSILNKKLNEPLIVIHPVRSLDDAIDFANSSADEPLAALLVFGSPDTGKYVSQFVNSHLCCVNDVPVELLVAPLTPVGFATQIGRPYRKEMFSIPKPQYIQFDDTSKNLSRIIDTNDVAEAAKLRKQAQTVDAQVKQPPGHAIGFFEQGLLFGASVAVTSVITGTVILGRYGIPPVLKALRRS